MRKVKFRLIHEKKEDEIWYDGLFHQWITKATCCDDTLKLYGIIENDDGLIFILPYDFIRFVDTTWSDYFTISSIKHKQE